MHIPEPAALRDPATRFDGDGFRRGVEPPALDFGSRLLAIEKYGAAGGEGHQQQVALGDAIRADIMAEIVLQYDYESGFAHPRWTTVNRDDSLGAWELRLSRVFEHVHATLVYRDGPIVWFTPQWNQASVNHLQPISPTGLVHLLSALTVKPA